MHRGRRFDIVNLIVLAMKIKIKSFLTHSDLQTTSGGFLAATIPYFPGSKVQGHCFGENIHGPLRGGIRPSEKSTFLLVVTQ
jgi:hypothetical protein